MSPHQRDFALCCCPSLVKTGVEMSILARHSHQRDAALWAMSPHQRDFALWAAALSQMLRPSTPPQIAQGLAI